MLSRHLHVITSEISIPFLCRKNCKLQSKDCPSPRAFRCQIFKSNNGAYQHDKTLAQLSEDIANSYPDSAAVNAWQRTIRLNRGKDVEVNDEIWLKKANQVIEHLMTCYPSEVGKPGELIIHYQSKDGTGKNFVVKYNQKQMK